MLNWGDYRRKWYIILPLVFVFIYYKFYSRTVVEKKTQVLSSSEIRMNHDHDHAAMLAASNSTAQTHTLGNGHGLNMMMMAMTFHGGYKETILFESWATNSTGAFVGSWFVVFFLAAFYEALKTIRDVLAQRDLCDACSQTTHRARGLVHNDDQTYEQTSNNDLVPSIRIENQHSKRARILSPSHMLQTLLHIIQMTISYLLMLIAMTFNTYLVLAVVLGAGLGHFLFGWRRSSVLDHNEHCH